jgi:hypothetical protein
LTDDLDAFGIPYEPTDDPMMRRAVSWKYQRELIRATPKPKHWIDIRFEDFVLYQEQTLARLEDFLGFPLARVPVNRESVGRWKRQPEAVDHCRILDADMRELGYFPEFRPLSAELSARV